MVLVNKESKFQDHSFRENSERSQHLLHCSSSRRRAAAPRSTPQLEDRVLQAFGGERHVQVQEKCQFPHGFHELRSLTGHPKYKTELCRTFHTIGFCSCSPRCYFIHNAD